ncbi:MAG: hypothetical protein K2X49_07880 [Acetobacteraceae bacterium]|nr:hypothetical protein [Acetobacteraceae bacterium]
MTRAQIKAAQDNLRGKLEQLLGPALDGVMGFGARLDRETRTLSLDVMANSQAGPKVRSELPNAIDGLPVRVHIGKAARFDGSA